jgi:hypothetical protein
VSAPQVPQRRASKTRQFVVLGILVLLLAGLLGAAWWFNRDAAGKAKAGDCVHEKGGDSISVVACDDPKADLKVLGRVEGKTQIEAGISISSVCDPFPGSQKTYWEGEQGKKGFVLCLGPK